MSRSYVGPLSPRCSAVSHTTSASSVSSSVSSTSNSRGAARAEPPSWCIAARSGALAPSRSPTRQASKPANVKVTDSVGRAAASRFARRRMRAKSVKSQAPAFSAKIANAAPSAPQPDPPAPRTGSGPEGATPCAAAETKGDALTNARVSSNTAWRSPGTAGTNFLDEPFSFDSFPSRVLFPETFSFASAIPASRILSPAPGRSSKNGSLSSAGGRAGPTPTPPPARTESTRTKASSEFDSRAFAFAFSFSFSWNASDSRASRSLLCSRATCSLCSHRRAFRAFSAALASRPRTRSKYSSKRNRHPHSKSCSRKTRSAKSKCFSSTAHKAQKNTARIVGSPDMRLVKRRAIQLVGVAPAKVCDAVGSRSARTSCFCFRSKLLVSALSRSETGNASAVSTVVSTRVSSSEGTRGGASLGAASGASSSVASSDPSSPSDVRSVSSEEGDSSAVGFETRGLPLGPFPFLVLSSSRCISDVFVAARRAGLTGPTAEGAFGGGFARTCGEFSPSRFAASKAASARALAAAASRFAFSAAAVALRNFSRCASAMSSSFDFGELIVEAFVVVFAGGLARAGGDGGGAVVLSKAPPLCRLALRAMTRASEVRVAPFRSTSSPLSISAAAAMRISAPESFGSEGRSATRFKPDGFGFDAPLGAFDAFDAFESFPPLFPADAFFFAFVSASAFCRRASLSSSCLLAAAAALAFASRSASALTRASSFFFAAARRRSATAFLVRYKFASSPHLSRSIVPCSSSLSVNMHRPSEMSSST
mmetsp:Transcript_5663/g.22911  ORF Transcript_5663/g.22911 Transcript_5663/m.22911 type:complete len:767 (-) Transcript_5663:311-2611(-)